VAEAVYPGKLGTTPRRVNLAAMRHSEAAVSWSTGDAAGAIGLGGACSPVSCGYPRQGLTGGPGAGIALVGGQFRGCPVENPGTSGSAHAGRPIIEP
jgi:hypothetical protein